MIEDYAVHRPLIRNYLVASICVTLFVLSFVAVWLIPPSLAFIRLILGIFGYVWLPGILLASLFDLFKPENIGLSLALGFLLQMFNVFISWMLSRIFGTIDFYIVTTALTLLSIIVSLSLISKRRSATAKETCHIVLAWLKRVDVFLLLIVILYLILALYFQQYAAAPTSDGASYLDIARNVLEKRTFRSNLVAPSNDWNNVVYATGGLPHMFGYFVFVLFFEFGGISFFAAKTALAFSGLLIILVTYLLTRELLGKNTARLASFLVSTSAVFLATVGLIGGPEFISILFVLLAFYLILIGVKSNSKMLLFFGGLSSFVAWYAWYINFYAFLGLLVYLVAYFASAKKEPVKTNVLISLLLFVSLLVDDRISANFGFEKVGFPIPILTLIIVPLVYLISVRKKLRLPKLSLTFVSTLTILDFAFLSFLMLSPESQVFQRGLLDTGITTANIARDIGMISRAFTVDGTGLYWNMYKTGLYQYLGQAILFLALLSFIRVKSIKETLLLAMFPLFYTLIWVFLVVIDRFQPRFVIGVSVFYDILAASAVVFVAKAVARYAPINTHFTRTTALKTIQRKLRIANRKLVGGLALALLLVSYFGLTYEMYTNGTNITESWNLRQEFGWDKAINWILNNTSPTDKLACTYGDYFAWYTNRQAALLWPYRNANMSVLIELIKTIKVNYLLVDSSFQSYFSNMRSLYDSPSPFLGSSIDFMSQNEAGKKVIVYNVTKIAYGNLTTYKLTPNWEILENWTPLSWYNTGNVSIDQDSIRVDSFPIERSPISAAVTFNFTTPTSLVKYSQISFWIKAPKSDNFVLEIYSGTQDQNYYVYSTENNVHNEWTRIVFDLEGYTRIQGNATLQNASKINFIVTGVPVGVSTTFWIKNIEFSEQEYVLENG